MLVLLWLYKLFIISYITQHYVWILKMILKTHFLGRIAYIFPFLKFWTFASQTTTGYDTSHVVSSRDCSPSRWRFHGQSQVGMCSNVFPDRYFHQFLQEKAQVRVKGVPVLCVVSHWQRLVGYLNEPQPVLMSLVTPGLRSHTQVFSLWLIRSVICSTSPITSEPQSQLKAPVRERPSPFSCFCGTRIMHRRRHIYTFVDSTASRTRNQ